VVRHEKGIGLDEVAKARRVEGRFRGDASVEPGAVRPGFPGARPLGLERGRSVARKVEIGERGRGERAPVASAELDSRFANLKRERDARHSIGPESRVILQADSRIEENSITPLEMALGIERAALDI